MGGVESFFRRDMIWYFPKEEKNKTTPVAESFQTSDNLCTF